MTLWKFEYQLILDGGAVSSHLIAHHDDERTDEIQDRFREFLRGCGYAVSDEDRLDTEVYIDELRGRIAELEDSNRKAQNALEGMEEE